MRRFIILISFILIGTLLTNDSYCQTDRLTQIKAQKVAFLTQKMDLTVDEAEKFWPIYNEYEASLNDLRSQNRLNSRNISVEDARKILMDNLEREEQVIHLKRTFYDMASKVVSYYKLLLLEKGEREFRLKILERYKSAVRKMK